MFAGYYVWDTLTMFSEGHAHSPSTGSPASSIEITSDTTGRVRAAHESILADEEGESVSVKKFFLEAYTEEKILVFIGLFVNAKPALCNVEQQHREQHLCSLRSRGFKYA